MIEKKEKRKKFAWISHFFDFTTKHSLKEKKTHKMVITTILTPIVLSNIILVLLITLLARYSVINLQLSSIIPNLGFESWVIFLLFSSLSIILYIIAYALVLYDIRELTEEEKMQGDRNFLKQILLLTSVGVVLQFVSLLFFSL